MTPKNGFREDCFKLCAVCFWYDEKSNTCERDLEEEDSEEEE